MAELTLYHALTAADVWLKPLFESMGWPPENIR